jgi:hypothetical protein
MFEGIYRYLNVGQETVRHFRFVKKCNLLLNFKGYYYESKSISIGQTG